MKIFKSSGMLATPPGLFKMILIWFILFLHLKSGASAFVAPHGLTMNYSEVQNLGNSCPNLDSCQSRRDSGSRELFSPRERNCACDYLCAEYGDCCIDAPSYPYSKNGNSPESFTCYELRQFGGVYLKDTCELKSDESKELKDLCENTRFDDYRDPLAIMPATNAQTGLTYKNYYCGLCDGNAENLVLWTPRLECPTLTFYNYSRKNLTDEYVFHNLVSDGSSWGLFLDGDNGSLFFHDCAVDPVMPTLLESKIRLCKTEAISECAADWNDNEVKQKCAMYTGLRYYQTDSYKNVHCALCNHIDVNLLSCHSIDYREILFRTFEQHAFSLLLDINERSGQNVGITQKCKEGEVFDPFFRTCRSLRCLPNFLKIGDKCVQKSPIKEPSFTTETSQSDEVEVVPINDDEFSRQRNTTYFDTEIYKENPLNVSDAVNANFQDTTGISYNISTASNENPIQDEVNKYQDCLLISLIEEDYILLENESIYVPKYDKIYEPTNYFSVDGSILVCSHLESDTGSKFAPFMGYVTIFGLGISMICLVLHFITFCIVPDLRNLSGKNLVSQCVALFCAYCCFIAGQLNQLSSCACTVVAFMTFYFFQVSFFWMSTMAYDIWRTLKMATTELRVSSGKQWKRFLMYTLFSWVAPLILIGLTALAEYTNVFPLEYRPNFAQPRCWFNHRRALLLFFALPLFIVMLSNIILFVSSAKMIIMTTKTTAKQQTQSQQRNFKLYLRLALLMGLTWVIGLVAGYADMEFLWYIFVIFNTLQGLFIFVAFSCSTKAYNHLRDSFIHYSRTESKSSTVHSASGSG